jgi:pilus assembly protein CpaE
MSDAAGRGHATPPATDSQPIRVVLAMDGELEGERVLRVLGQRPEVAVVGLAQNGSEAARLAVQLLPDLVLLDEHLAEMDGLAAATAISLAAPQVATVLLTGQDPAALWRRAIRAGVRGILATPVDPAEVLETIQEVERARAARHSREFQTLVDPDLVPRVIAIAGAKGGVGKTTVAVNLAALLSRRHEGQTVLVDLYSQFGDVALMLNLHPARALVDMVAMEEEMDQDLLEAHLTSHESGLKVLAGATSPTALNLISSAFLRTVLGLLKHSYRFIVLDVPPLLYETTTCALTHATAVALVANLYDLTTLNDTRRLHHLLVRDYVPRERIHLVLNRMARSNRLRADEIENAFGRAAAATIPNATRLAVSSINEGRPFVITHPEAAISRSIEALAGKLTRMGQGGAGAAAPEPLRRATPEDPVLSQAARSGDR